MISTDLSGLNAERADVTVIGSGPAGITLALECARLGKSVLLLESGGNAASEEAQSLSLATICDRNTHDDMAIAVARRFGGTSNLWGARCQRLDPIDFAQRPGVVEAKWPITRDDILPFYDIACEYASCGKPVFASAIENLKLEDSVVDPCRLERFSNRPAFQTAHKESLSSSRALDVRLNATVVDFELDESGRIEKLVVATPDRKRTIIPVKTAIIACGGLESTRLLLAIQRKHPDMFGGLDGPLGRYYMGHVIGEIADIVFSTEEIDRAYDFFIDGNGSYARRRMILSDKVILDDRLLNCAFWPVVPPVSDSRHGSSILSLVYLAFAVGPIGRALVAEAIRIRHVPPGVATLPHIRNILLDIPHALAYLPGFFNRRYFAEMRLPGFFIRNPGRRYGLSYHQEQFPDPASRVQLNGEADMFGLPRLTIDLKFNRTNADALVRSHERLEEWLVQSRLGALRYRFPKEELADAVLAQASHGTHQIGTARMGLDRRTAVVDGDLRTFDSSNLYVVSSAVMPTSGQANPTLSVVALAARLAQHLASVG
ncbi:Choline dehydrogenase [Bradyrhizobium lablabi]|uniref:Choline dehydrogenase n=1 Tax=Bradyrhizobium lablabi TaxID=722472 RepID=A0A1M6MP32_9BRAD|nr:FAD-dependent oxidoreductase [Bradyrhizobium lablabi]SHJ85043.1 Choline dehydrogenase [Bradyrhizobium lablabi]